MLKLEIKLNDAMIQNEGKYSFDSIQHTLDKVFGKYQFRKEEMPDGTISYYGNGRPQDYGTFGRLITTLKDKSWFLPYLEKWICFLKKSIIQKKKEISGCSGGKMLQVAKKKAKWQDFIDTPSCHFAG